MQSIPIATLFGISSFAMLAASGRAVITMSLELLPGTEVIGGRVITLEVFIHSTTQLLVRGAKADLPREWTPQAGATGSITSLAPNPVFISNASNPLSGSIPWIFAPQGTCTGGPNAGNFCMTSNDCANSDCDTSAHNGGLRPIAQVACRFSGSPNAGEESYVFPANAKRYLGTIRYQVSECATGDFTIDYEVYTLPDCFNTDLTRIVNDDNSCLSFTAVLPTLTAGSPILYADFELPFGVVSLHELLCILAGYISFSDCPQGDISPCGGGDGTIELGDVLAVVAAYGGDYFCPPPCQP